MFDGQRAMSEKNRAMIAELRRLSARELPAAPAAGPEERCDLCNATIPADHRHLLHLEQRQIVCSCETCRALLSGDSPYRPTGTRTVWLDGFDLPDELWASIGIPIALAFFYRDGRAGAIQALYPSPAGATRSEVLLGAWSELVEANPVLADLESDIEALLVDRLGEERRYVIAPIDECYRLVGLIRTHWEGISGGRGVERAVNVFFGELRDRAAR
jgi:hypothetical protein